MIDNRTIEQVFDKANIVDVVSDYVDLHKAGVNYKGLCPFHADHNPSFIVSPGKNIAHCFVCGKGGNPVHFIMEKEGMSFPEAIKFLAKKYNIEVIEDRQERTDEEIEIDKKRDSMRIVYEAATEFYYEQLHNSTVDANKALAYVNNRWNHRQLKKEVDGKNIKMVAQDDDERDFPNLMRIGYAPNSWDTLVNWAKAKGYSLKLLEEAGLIKMSSKGNLIDVFRNRVMIPWRNKWGNTIAFTARTLEEDTDGMKYLNNKDSIYFHKGSSIFGIDMAKNAGAREEKFYLVEGGPDVMQLQSLNINNTIAPGGTAWTHEEFEQLHRYNATLCFIPDADEPGIKGVIKNGRKAISEGFRVTVKEIPTKANGEKQDADSYIKSRGMLDNIDEEDFIIWFASKTIDDDDNVTDRTDKISAVCDILVDINDDYTQGALLEKLGNKYGSKNIWRSALKKSKEVKERRKVEAISKKGDIDLLKRYGFYEEHNCYYSNNGDKSVMWSNFTMKPLFHIKDSFNAKRIYRLKNFFGHEDLIELKTEELISLPKFMQRVESLGNYLWNVSSEELKKLKAYLYENTESAIEIKQLGWNKEGFFVWGNGIYVHNHFIEVDDYGIVRIEKTKDNKHIETDCYYLPAMSKIYSDERELFKFERMFIFDENHSSISLHNYADMMISVFGDNAKVGLMFLFATLFRDVIISYTKNFPILNLFGPKGSGKSELGHTLMSFFIKNNTPLNIQNATIAALADAIAQCSNSLVHIDEYKNSVDPVKIEFLKGLYDGTGRSRMNMELDKKRQITSVDSAVILSGQEMPTVDIALFSRTIYLTFETTVHDRDAKIKFNELTAIRKMGVSHLTNDILSHRAKFESDFYENYNYVSDDLCRSIASNEVEDRIWRDWAVLLASFRCLESSLDLPFKYEEAKSIIIEGIKRQNIECAASNELGNFWDMVEFMNAQGMISNECDFKIKYLNGIVTNITNRMFDKETPILMIRPKHIILQYKKAAKQTDEKAMSERSIRFYLLTSPGYLGKKKGSERFKVIINGQLQKDYSNSQNPTDIIQFDNPMCFDYKILKQKFEINLEVGSQSGMYDDEEDKPQMAESNLPFPPAD